MLSYASPFCATAFLLAPTWHILPALYSKYFGLELTVVAMVVLLSRIFDAITDPLIGYLSNRHRLAGGSRKLWVAVGGALFVVSATLLFIPPNPVSVSYYLICSFLFFASFTMVDIPHVSWGSEIATGYYERAKIYSYRQGMASVGEILFNMMPFLMLYSVSEYTPEVIKLTKIYYL